MLTIAAESAAPRTGHGRRRIHPTRPASDDFKLVLSNSLREHRIKGEKKTESVAQCAIAWRWGVAHLGAVHDDARTLGCHRILVHIARDTASRQGRKSARLEISAFLGFPQQRGPQNRKDPRFAQLTSSLPELGSQTERSRTEPVRGTGRGTNRGSSRRASRAGAGSPGPKAPRCLFEFRVTSPERECVCVCQLYSENPSSVDERRLLR